MENSDSNINYDNCPISPRGLSRHGPKVWLKDQPARPSDRVFPMVVVGMFVDDRSFSQRRVHEWINRRWRTFGKIVVEKVGFKFMLHCSDIRDRDNLVDQESASLEGALFVMAPWYPQASVQAFEFKYACLWVRVEGLPLTAATPNFVTPILNEIGRVIYFDEESLGPGTKEFLRVRMRIPLELSLIPGFYFEAIPGEFIWVYLRYEHVFIFCTVCGRIGHESDVCKVTVCDMKKLLGERMGMIAKMKHNVKFEEYHVNMFTNKLIGLKRSAIYKSSCINLVNYKRWRPERVIMRKKPSHLSSDSSSSSEGSESSTRSRRKRKVRSIGSLQLDGGVAWEEFGEGSGGTQRIKITVPIFIRRSGKNIDPICTEKKCFEELSDESSEDRTDEKCCTSPCAPQESNKKEEPKSSTI